MLIIKTVLCLASFVIACRSSWPFLMSEASFNEEFRQLTTDQQVPLKEANDTDNTQSLADYNKAVGNIVSIGAVVEQFALPGTSSGISSVNSVNMMQFVRYVNMSYPENVEQLFKAQGTKTVQFNFGPLFPSSLLPYVRKYWPTGKFSTYQKSSLFLVNYWKTIITIPILIVGTVIVILLGKLGIKNPLYNKVYGFVRNFLVWNFLISFVLSNIDSLTICSLVEIGNLRLDSPIAIVSFSLNISLVLTAIILLIIFTRKAYLISKQDKKTDLKEKLEKYTTTKVLFEELKNTYLHQELFVSISVIRIIVNNIIIGTTHQPVVQTIFLLATNISFMLYLALGRPYVSRLRNLELFCYEATTLAVNIACVRLSFMESEEQRNSMVDSNAITRSTAAVSTLSIFFSVLKNGLIFMNIVKAKLAERKKTEKKSSSNELPDAKKIYLENGNENEKVRLTEEERSLHIDIIQDPKKKANNSFDLEKTGLEKTSVQLLNLPKRALSLEQTYSYFSSSRSSSNGVESIRNKEL